MIKHSDWDKTGANTKEEAYKIPKEVENISFSHDGGRIEISINGDVVYESCTGTRDCTIKIDNT